MESRQRQHRNLESYTLLWCQKNFEKTEDIQLKLRQSINYLKIFSTIIECHQYIKNNIIETPLGDNENIILIVSLEFVDELMLHVHQVRQIIGIYIYSPTDKGEQEILQKKFNKVKRIHPIPQCCTFGNQFRPGINSVQFLEFLNRVKIESRNWVESVPAPESIPFNSWNS
jgi:hypothetical protein